MDKGSALFVVAAMAVLLTGCDIYSTTPAGDGSVIVVNRMTGTISRVQGNQMEEVHLSLPNAAPTATKAPLVARRVFPPVNITQQPVTVSGVAKYRDGQMLLRVNLSPDDASMNDGDWLAWRSHLGSLKAGGVALVQLRFEDADGFEITTQTMRLGEMLSTVDEKGLLSELSAQAKVSMPEVDFDSITTWEVSWSGWLTYNRPKKST